MNVMAAKAKVLIVEDDEDFSSILVHVLEKEGYAAVTAGNGEDGLKRYAQEAPDLVLLDVHLPDMTGFDICRKIRSQGPHSKTPVILCTVRSAVAPVAEGLGSGADDYVVKPFNIQDLLSRIAAILKARQG